MQNEYYNFIKELSRGRMTVVRNRLNKCSIEELAVMEWNPYLGETFYNITALHRKKKLNKQFVFNQKNIQAIVNLDQLFKETCRQLKSEVQKEFNNLMEREKQNANTFFFFIEACIKIGSFKSFNSFLDCAYSVYNESLSLYDKSPFQFELSTNEECWTNKIDELPIFDFITNFSDKLADNNILTEHHIGYAFYEFYSESLFSLQDMLEINTLEAVITPHFTLKVSLQN